MAFRTKRVLAFCFCTRETDFLIFVLLMVGVSIHQAFNFFVYVICLCNLLACMFYLWPGTHITEALSVSVSRRKPQGQRFSQLR